VSLAGEIEHPDNLDAIDANSSTIWERGSRIVRNSPRFDRPL
jgi:hypothetical protein